MGVDRPVHVVFGSNSGPMRRSKPSFDHLVGGGEEGWRDSDVESFGGLQVDHFIELDRHLDRQITRLGALEDAIDIIGRAAIQIVGGDTIGHQPVGLGEEGVRIDCR